MIRHSSVFSQILAIFSRFEFASLVKKHQNDKGAKGFSSWDQCVSMLFCQLAKAHSLRDISNGLRCCLGKLKHIGMKKAPAKSTLAYANEHRSWKLYEDLFYQTLNHVQVIAPKKKFRFKNKMFSVDATVIDLCITIFPWAKFRRAKGAVKLHMILDHDGYLPTFVHISDGKKADVKALPLMDFPEGSVVAMDRGYNDYRIFALWTEKKVWFVTRMKDNAVYRVVEKREIPKNRNIISDEVIELTGVKAEEKCPYLLRRVVVWNEENEREIVLLTNNFNFGATTIAAIYKERWQIELFFKALKQNLKIKTFVGTTANALHIQIWTALIAMLLLKYMQFKSRLNWSMSNLAVMVAWNLFTYRDLWHWLDYPFETPPEGIENIEQKMLFPDFGQQLKCLKATT